MVTTIAVTIGAMRTGFYAFHGLWSSSRVPFRIKRIVFKAVVSSAGLAGLEPYVLTQTDMDRLEVARDLLMRRIFGRDGWGAVAGSCEHKSVPSHSLRKKADLRMRLLNTAVWTSIGEHMRKLILHCKELRLPVTPETSETWKSYAKITV